MPTPHLLIRPYASSSTMASVKLSSALKALISAPHAQGAPLPPPAHAAVTRALERLASSAAAHGVAEATWLTLGVRISSRSLPSDTVADPPSPPQSAALVTLNSPATLCELYTFATSRLQLQGEGRTERAAEIAAIVREVGLKTISFSGIPRVHSSFPLSSCHPPRSSPC